MGGVLFNSQEKDFTMIRIVEARKAAVSVATDQEVVLEFVDADLKAIVGSQGAYQPVTGVLKASGTGVISNITKMICRRKESPDQSPVLIFSLTNGLTLAEFNAMLAHDTVGLDLPKYPVLGGYEILLTLDLGTAVSDISFVTKGENAPFAVGSRNFVPFTSPGRLPGAPNLGLEQRIDRLPSLGVAQSFHSNPISGADSVVSTPGNLGT